MIIQNMITDAHLCLNRLHDHHLEPKRLRIQENRKHFDSLSEAQKEQLAKLEGEANDLEDIISTIRKALISKCI
jgi:septal ring factor EnvC (AmiA/AmiB activator)